MSKVPANAFLLLRKQVYSAGVENVRMQVAAATSEPTRNNAVDSSNEDKGIAEQKSTTTVDKEIMPPAGKKEEFWMRDPKTGNWIPETHINEVDPAELRDKFLPKKAKH